MASSINRFANHLSQAGFGTFMFICWRSGISKLFTQHRFESPEVRNSKTFFYSLIFITVVILNYNYVLKKILITFNNFLFLYKLLTFTLLRVILLRIPLATPRRILQYYTVFLLIQISFRTGSRTVQLSLSYLIIFIFVPAMN